MLIGETEELMADTHVAVTGSKRVPLPGARALGRANPHTTIEVSLKLRRKNELPDLTGRPSATLSREELGKSMAHPTMISTRWFRPFRNLV